MKFSLRMKHERLWIAVITLLFVILGVVYSLATPIFEASDELWHYPVVKHIADGRGLPVQKPGVEALWQQEGSQPPAYYALAALVTAWIDTDDLSEVRWLNPLANTGKPLAAGNKNLVIHTEGEAFPWRGSALAVHLVRFLSVLLGACVVYLTYLLALEVSPQRSDLALAAAALVAFNPMFIFISGSVNNDNLIVPLATLILWLVVRTLRQGWLSNGRAVLLGLLLGLAALTKLSGLALLPLTAAVLVVVAARRRAWGALFRWGALIAVPVIAVAGWWYLRNWQLYGDPTGLNAMLDIAGRRPEPFTFQRSEERVPRISIVVLGRVRRLQRDRATAPLLVLRSAGADGPGRLDRLAGAAPGQVAVARGRAASRAGRCGSCSCLSRLIRWTSADVCLAGPAGLPSDRRYRRPRCLRSGGLAAPALAGARIGRRQRPAFLAGRGDPVCGDPPGVRPATHFDGRLMCRRTHNAAT